VTNVEALKALLDGHTVCNLAAAPGKALSLSGGVLKDQAGKEWTLSWFSAFPSGWSLLAEEELTLCPADVGRRARLWNGNVILLTWCTKNGQSFSSPVGNYDCNGVSQDGRSEWNIKELLG
jgi:hypothetical protein